MGEETWLVLLLKLRVMKKLLVLIDKIGESSEILAEYIGERLGKDSKLVLAKFSDLMFEIEEGSIPRVWVNGVDIREFSLIYFRRVGHDYLSTAGTLALCLDKLGIKYFDAKFREIGAAGDKFTSLTKLSIGGIPVPHTVFLWKKQLESHAREIFKKLGDPVIAKEYATQGNKEIFILRKVKDFERLASVKVEEREGQFLFQKFIDIDREYRLLVTKDRIAVVHTKAVRDYHDFRVVDNTPEDNITFIDPKEISDELKYWAVAAAKKLGVEVAGVDGCIEKGTGKVYIFEVNRGPGLIHDPKKSPELSELAKFFVRELRKA